MEFNRDEIFNSYLFLRKVLGMPSKDKDGAFLIGIRYTGNQILALNENSTITVLLIERMPFLERWFVGTPYKELVPLADHIKKAVEGSSNPLLSEPAFDALKEVLNYKV